MLISNAECLTFNKGFNPSFNLSPIKQDIRIEGGIVTELGKLQHLENETVQWRQDMTLRSLKSLPALIR